MGFRMEDLGEVGYGAGVAWAEWWDDKRITDGKITNKDVLKKAGTYVYWGVGLGALLSSSFGWLRGYGAWTERMSHGFLYDLTRNVINLNKAMNNGTARSAGSRAVQQAQAFMAANRQLNAGIPAARAYEPEFNTVGVV